MTDFNAPLADTEFVINGVINELTGIENLSSLPGYEDATPDLVSAILEEAGKLATEVLAPLNRSGDIQGCVLENGVVRTPDGFKEAYRQMAEGGWTGTSADQEFGGQGLPYTVTAAAIEFWTAANMAFCLVPVLMQSAIELIQKHGSDDQKNTFLPKIISGEWASSMDLTEPQAGSDLGLLRTRAVKNGDHYLLTGQKIFITGGDQDLTENIIHLVLARTPDAPPGAKGISLFLVPKFLVNEDGSLGRRNDMRAVSVEHKLGINGSPTCVMSYGDDEGAVGYLIIGENQGLIGMFTMMNLTRLTVGIQGVGIAERAYQQALAYARERLQGSRRGEEADGPMAIINHPDVKRMLLDMKARSEAMRAITLYTGLCIDLSKRLDDDEQREKYRSRVELLTPIAKAWVTDQAIDIANIGIQVHGGLGFIEETGAAQHLRDARITPIYEGTNGIQANDLVGRKVIRDRGDAVKGFIAELRDYLSASNSDLDSVHTHLCNAVDCLAAATEWMIGDGQKNTLLPAAAATSYLNLIGTVLGGWLLAKSAETAERHLSEKFGDPDFNQGKILSARYFADTYLAACGMLKDRIIDGGTTVMDIEPKHFGNL